MFMTEFRPRSDMSTLKAGHGPPEELETQHRPVTREEYLTLRARTTCLEHVVAAFAASLRSSTDRDALTDLLREGSRRYANQRPDGFAPTLPEDERDGQWTRLSEEFAELRALINDLSWNDDPQPRAAEERSVFRNLKTTAVRLWRSSPGTQRTGTSKSQSSNLVAHIGDPLRDYFKHVVHEPLPDALMAIVGRFDRKLNARG
jgi:hypothetical protein